MGKPAAEQSLMQSDWNRTSCHDVQTIPAAEESTSHKIAYHPVPIKAKIHGAELIAKEKININWDDSNYDNYFYDDNDDSRNACDNSNLAYRTRAVSIPKYTVVYSARPGMPILHNSADDPEVDLRERGVSTKLNPSELNQSFQATNEAIIQDSVGIGRSSGPREFSYKGVPVANITRTDDLFERTTMQHVTSADISSYNNQTTCMTVAPSMTEYKPEVFPKERHCLSRGSRSNSSCTDTERTCSPNKQKMQTLCPTSPRASEYTAKHQSLPSQMYMTGSPDASLREERSQNVEATYHRASIGTSQRQQPSALISSPRPVPTTITHQQPYAQGTHSIQAPKQAHITASRASLSNNMPLTADQPLSSRSPQRLFSREKRSNTSEPLTTNKARIPQPYQRPPQPIPQQCPADVSVNSVYDEQFYTRATSERASPRRSTVSSINYNALKLQDAVRQADELHSRIIKQSYTKRSTLDDPYSETLARADAIISPKRVAPTSYNTTQHNHPALSTKMESEFSSTMPQVIDINNRIKEAMTIARNIISSQQSDGNARTSVSSPTRGLSPSNSTYNSVPSFASPISAAGRRQVFQSSDGASPSLQLARKYIDVAGITRVSHGRTISPARGTSNTVSAEVISHRMTTDPSYRSPTHQHHVSRVPNSYPSIDEMETAKHLTSRIAIQQEGKRVPSSTQNLTIKAASPSRGRQYTPLY